MKTRSHGNPAPAISKSRWIAYATASAASMFVGSQHAEAAIHYSGPVDIKIPPSGSHRKHFPLDQPGDYIVFEHLESIYNYPNEFAGFKVKGIVYDSLRGAGPLELDYVYNLRSGDLVSNGNFTHKSPRRLSGFGRLAGVVSGYFADRGIGFVGFAFDGGAGKQYGWARVFMTGWERGNGIKLVDYAYADPGEPIQVGQTSSEQAVPAVGSLGLLAAGAAGLVVWRRRRRRASANM